MATTQEQSYNAGHVENDALYLLPMSIMHTSLGAYALGDCIGKNPLDLGEGSGLDARTAIDQGASRVDVADLSPGMMENGIKNKGRLGRKDRIRRLEGDISEPTGQLPLDDGYDVVMMNWTDDRAEILGALEVMWDNVARYTKSAGKLINIRMTTESVLHSATSTTLSSDINPFNLGERKQYSVTISGQEPTAGGAKYVYTVHVDPEFSCPAAFMATSWDVERTAAMGKKNSFEEFEEVTAKECIV